jgi:hypothetical protein
MDHPLHFAIAVEIQKRIPTHCELFKDTACGGAQHLPLFVGKKKGRDTHMCDVDLIIISKNKVRCIVEIEESGFLPTKICGKFLQSAFATHFIYNVQPNLEVPYGDRVLFVQVLDGSKWNQQKTSKYKQANLIENKIRNMLSFKGSNITDYHLCIIQCVDDFENLESVGAVVANVLVP